MHPLTRRATVALILLSPLLALPHAFAADAPAVPAEADLKALATQSLVDFNDALQKKDFAAFHDKASAALGKQFTAEQLLKTFGDFIDKQANLSGVARVEPAFDGAAQIDADGVLTVKGYFPTKPFRVVFRLRYVNESEQWRLLGISVDLKADTPLPPDAELAKLVTRTLASFDAAAKAGDFVAFHKAAAAPFQEQFTPERLADEFREFTARHVDLAGITEAPPVFDKPPELAGGTELTLEGHSDLPAMRVPFKLKYVQEQGQWRLISIDVSTAAKPQ